jgi:hypothetical protein
MVALNLKPYPAAGRRLARSALMREEL